jgi:hypothetical protein
VIDNCDEELPPGAPGSGQQGETGETLNASNFMLVPNPSVEVFQIKPMLDAGDIVFDWVEVYDSRGLLVAEYKEATTETKFSLEGATKGMYFVHFSRNGKAQTLLLTLK